MTIVAAEASNERGDENRLAVAYSDGVREEWPISADEAERWRLPASMAVPGQSGSYLYRNLTARPFWDERSGGLAAFCYALEEAHSEMRQEAMRLLRASLLGEAGGSDSECDEEPPAWASAHGEGLVGSGVWQKVHLWTGRTRHADGCAALPRTAELLERFGDAVVMRDSPGRAFLSLMLPGTRVLPHAGPTNHRLRVHLPLVLPRSDAGGEAPCLVVGGEAREWALGRALVFDDSFTHEVRFPQGRAEPGPEQAAGGECAEEGRWEALLARLRLLLVVDVWHPEARAAGGPFHAAGGHDASHIGGASASAGKRRRLSPDHPSAARLETRGEM